MAKMKYVEPSGYFTPSAKKILEAGEKKATKSPAKKSSTTKSTKK